MDDRRALEDAYTAHKDRLLVLATTLTGDRSVAEDVVHDVFASLIKDPERLHSNARLSAFLTVCTRNRAFDLQRRNKRQTVLSDTEATEGAEGAGHNPAEHAVRAEERDALLDVVAGLGDDLREVLTLRVWGDLTFEEIAGLQHTTKSTAHARYGQALEQLRTTLAKGE